jgi:uncharacterized membrane protein YidH (DUF202 family)
VSVEARSADAARDDRPAANAGKLATDERSEPPMEEDLETAELKEKIDERIEAAEERATPGWVKYLSLSTAMVAVFAAVASLQSGSYSNEAILEKSDAMLNQARASDAWAYYQAKSVKAAIAGNQQMLVADTRPEAARQLEAQVKRYRDETEKIQEQAKAFEDKVAENDRESRELMHKHHKFAITVTMLQIAIALSAIAALTRRRPLWFLGLAVSVAGLANFVLGFVT